MKRGKAIIWLIMVMIPVLLAGCNDNAKLDNIAESQKEILTKLTELEKKIDGVESKVTAVSTAQKELAKVAGKPSRPKVDYNKVHKIPIGSSAIKGKKDAPVTIVEFSDFQCPYCSRLQPTLEEVLKAYPNEAKLVFKDFPLSFHKQAMNAARAARAAGEQGKYWEMHDLLFRDFNKLTDASYDKYAKELGLDPEKFKADFTSGKYDKHIRADMQLGREVGVTGTPTLFVNGKRMRSRSVSDFKAAIDGYLKKK